MNQTQKIPAIIVDLDGTLCNVDHRVHHVQNGNRNWIEFNNLMVHDDLNHWCFELIEAMSLKGYKTIFVTGRGEGYRQSTEEWLHKHSVKYEHLYMRAILDQSEDADVKESIYAQMIEQKYQVLFVVDDRKSVVERWRKMKLICLQCDVGDF